MPNLDSILKSRGITLLIKVHIVKAMIFPVVRYGCESWTIKRLGTKELMPLNCGIREDAWESLGLQGDQTSQSERKPTLNIHWKDWHWSWSSNTLVTWCEELTHWKDSDAGKDWRQKQKRVAEDEMVDGVTKSMDVSLNKLWETVKDRKGWCAVVHGVTKSRTWLSDWTTREAHCLDKVGTQIRWRRCLESWV